MLAFAVALVTGAIFASCTVAYGIEKSMQESFARMGADLIVVPMDTMVNITSALLTVQPTDSTMDGKILDEIARLSGVAEVAPQTIYKVPIMAGMPEHKVNIIAFDPKLDFTVQPWLVSHLPRSMQTGELICGGRRNEKIGDEVEPCGVAANIYGKLGRSGVGPLDESFFATYDTVQKLLQVNQADDALPKFKAGQLSAVLVRISVGATPEQVRFALAALPGVKVVSGTKIITSTRQTTGTLLMGLLGFAALMLLGSFILIALLFFAIISERRREIGLLRAIGSRRGRVVSMLVAEATLTTGLGGFLGIAVGSALLLAFQRSLVFYLETMHIDFTWPALTESGILALLCAAFGGAMGILGSIVPAVQSVDEEPYLLIKAEG
jgi:putative ABC transport system permease protein